MIFNPHPYQQHACQHIIDHPGCGLFLEMGLGKTVTTLTAIEDLIYNRMEVTRVLVIAPKSVAEDVWTTEAQKWDHLKHLKISLVLGNERKRKAALQSKADIYVINRELTSWIQSHYGGHWPFDMVVIDELSSFKSEKSQRFKALRMVRPKMNRVVGLTGTPAPNGLMDLWAQLYLLDQGERLGKTQKGYRDKFFKLDEKTEYTHYKKFRIRDSAGMDEAERDLMGDNYYQRKIYDRIGDICISMKSRDYLDLPPRLDTITHVHMPDELKTRYREFERDQVLAMQDVDDITALTAAALYNKLLQFANGAVYDSEKVAHEVHNLKMEALADRIEAANGRPVLVMYSFQSDLDRMMRHLKHFGPVKYNSPKDRAAWDAGRIPVLCGHPASMAHGLNLQHGGHIIEWYGRPWNLEWYQQAIARLDRQGQTMPVLNNSLIMRGTLEEEVIDRTGRKAGTQNELMDAIKAVISRHRRRKAA